MAQLEIQFPQHSDEPVQLAWEIVGEWCWIYPVAEKG